MKKSLFLLPLLAGLALCGCKKDSGGGGGGTGGGGSTDDEEPVALDLTLDFDTLFEAAGSKKTGYAAIAAIDELGGAEVAFTSVCVMRYYSDGATKEGSSIPAWTADEDDPALAIQFKAGAGEIEFYNVTCSKVTVVLLSSYEYKKGDNISVEFDGSKITEECANKEGEETEWKAYGTKTEGGATVTDFETTHAIKRFELTFDVGAEDGGDLRIYNSGAKGMRSVESIIIE